MSFNINDIRANLRYGGARPNQFYVHLTNPANSSGDSIAPFMIQAASLPSTEVGVIEVPYFGRRIKLAGDRVFPSWQVSVINDEDFLIRNALEEWSNRINGKETNLRTISNYKSEATITQLGKDGRTLRTYRFHGLWPSNIQAIDMDWGATDTIQNFSVEFMYDWWTVDGATGNGGGS